MQKTKLTKLLCIALSLMMLLSAVPLTASAVNIGEKSETFKFDGDLKTVGANFTVTAKKAHIYGMYAGTNGHSLTVKANDQTKTVITRVEATIARYLDSEDSYDDVGISAGSKYETGTVPVGTTVHVNKINASAFSFSGGSTDVIFSDITVYYLTKDTADKAVLPENALWILPNNSWYTINGDTLYIGGAGKVSTLDSIKLPDTVTKVIVKDGITELCDYAFFGKKNIKTIEIPKTVTIIGKYAFSGCTALTELIFDYNNISFNNDAFTGVDTSKLTLKSICSSTNPTKLSAYASSKGIAFGLYHLTEHGSDAYEYGVCKVCGKAHENHDYADGKCTVCGAVELPSGAVWKDESNVNRIWVKISGDTMTVGGEGVLSSLDFSKYANGSNVTKVVVENGIERIESQTFFTNKQIQYVTLPDTVTAIDGGLFYKCTALKEVHFPDSLTDICESVCRGCSSLESVTLPKGLTSVPIYGFADCTSLKSIVIPDSVTLIDEKAFCNCENLESVTMPKNLIEIGSSAFANCKSLKSISVPEGVETINSSVFENCTSLDSVVFPASVKEFNFGICENVPGDITFLSDLEAYRNGYKSNVLYGYQPKPDSSIKSRCYANIINDAANHNWQWESIGHVWENGVCVCGAVCPHEEYTTDEYGNEYCTHCHKVNLPENASWLIETDGYDYKNTVGRIWYTWVGDTVTIGGIGELPEFRSAWMDKGYSYDVLASDIKKIIILDGIDAIADEAFYGFYAVEEITLPAKMKKIGTDAFNRLENLKEIVIPEGVEEIPDYEFDLCSSLSKVVIPDTVTRIGRLAFDRCPCLTDVVFPESVKSVGPYIFMYGAETGTVNWTVLGSDVTFDEGFFEEPTNENVFKSIKSPCDSILRKFAKANSIPWQTTGTGHVFEDDVCVYCGAVDDSEMPVARVAAREEIDAAVPENASDDVIQIANDAKEALRTAATTDDIDAIVEAAKADIAAQTAFEKAKAEAIAELEAAADGAQPLAAMIAEYSIAIINSADTAEEITAAKESGLQLIDALVNDYKAALEETQDALDEAEAALADAQDEITAKTATINETQAKLDAAEEKLTEANAQITALTSELDTTKAALADTKAELETVKTEKAALETQLAAKIDVLADLTATLGEKEDIITALETDIDDLETAIDEKDAAIAALTDTVASLEKTVVDAEADIAAKQAKIDELTTQLEAANAELNDFHTNCPYCGKVHQNVFDKFFCMIIRFFNFLVSVFEFGAAA